MLHARRGSQYYCNLALRLFPPGTMGFSAASILNKVAEGVGKAQAVVSPALEQGARALESEDPNIVKTIVKYICISHFTSSCLNRL